MSGRFDQLEQQIVEALRRAEGPMPSADLDARILARAHRAVRPVQRAQSRWFGLAAGLVVLVGSGLALRIWQQVERAPSVLDRPPAASVPAAPTTGAPPPEPAQAASAGEAAAIHEQLAAPEARAQPAAVAGDEGAAAKLAVGAGRSADSLSNSSTDDGPRRAAAPAAVATPPPPAEPAPATAMEAPASTSPPAPGAEGLARPFPGRDLSGMVLQDAAPLPPAQSEAPVGEQAPASDADLGARPGPATTTLPAAPPPAAAAQSVVEEAQAERQRSAEAQLDRAEDDLVKRESAGPADSPAKPAADAFDDFEARIGTLREARRAGDEDGARRLLAELRRDYPQRELPPDLANWAEGLR